ncbi:hypothetical protein Tco_1453155, partial [Tanacetum coccineum]
HALLNPTHTSVKVHDSEDSLVHAEVSRTKMSEILGTIKPINYAELNALYSHLVPQKGLSREQVYWLPAEELATQKSNPPKPLKDQLQGKDDTIRKIAISYQHTRRCLNVGSTVGNPPGLQIDPHGTQVQPKSRSLLFSVNCLLELNTATESRQPMPIEPTLGNHRILPSKSVNARRAADHNRKLNVVDHN